MNRLLGMLRGKWNQINFVSINGLSVKEQREFLSRFPLPKDDLERSFFQYKCQRYLQGSSKLALLYLNFFALLFLLISIIMSSFTILVKKNNKNTIASKSYINALAYKEGDIPDFVPKTLADNLVCFDVIGNCLLTLSDWKFIFQIIKKYPFHFLFISKIVTKISAYSQIIRKYHIKQIVCSCEYSYTSSILTYYCETNNIEHVNVMHGEKLFFIRDSFCRFSKSYVWDDYYINLFKVLRHDEKQQFIIYLPASMYLDITPYKHKALQTMYDYTYYLQKETEEELIQIANILDRLVEQGLKIKIRPHPRYSQLTHLRHIFTSRKLFVEDVARVTINESLATTRKVIAKFSTVLNQAYKLDIPFVIDNVTDKELYMYLCDAEYIMLSKPHSKLSDELYFYSNKK